MELIRRKKMAGRAVLLAGPPGTGKSMYDEKFLFAVSENDFVGLSIVFKSGGS